MRIMPVLDIRHPTYGYYSTQLSPITDMYDDPSMYPPSCYADMYRGGHSASSSYHQSAAASSAASHLQYSFQQLNNNISATAAAATHEFYGNNQMGLGCYEPSPPHHSLVSGVDTIDLATARSVVPPSYGYPCPMPGMEQHLNMYPSPHSMWQSSQSLADDKRGPVIMGQAPSQPPVKRKGGRKPKDDPNLPPVEKEKRRLRRLRNKEAAAKCRERRLNHTSSLLQQIEQLEKSQKTFEDKITNLRQHKEQCEKLLTSHSKDCGKLFTSKSPPTAAVSSSCTAQSSLTSSPASTKTTSRPTTPHPTTPLPLVTNQTASQALSHSTSLSANRRKQTTPRLNLDISCSDSHRRTSSSSSGELQSPPVIL